MTSQHERHEARQALEAYWAGSISSSVKRSIEAGESVELLSGNRARLGGSKGPVVAYNPGNKVIFRIVKGSWADLDALPLLVSYDAATMCYALRA